ncbi:MAG: FIST N-terminal domain-containing protein [Phycisphaerales bacterium]|nr:FIST N-terminal domain-containing protein [Phycisphaerales bacterium]
MSSTSPTQPILAAAAAVSGHLDTRTSATEVAHKLHDALGGKVDLVISFASFHHRAALQEGGELLRTTLNPDVNVAVTTEGVVGCGTELEGLAGWSTLALQLPGVDLQPWRIELDQSMPEDLNEVSELIGYGPDYRSTILLADPFTTQVPKILGAMSACAPSGRPMPVVGGLISGASQAGHNVLLLNDQLTNTGAVGISLSGDIEVDCLVSHGARPIGEPLVITKANQNMILELGGKKATEVLQRLPQSIAPSDHELLKNGVLIGIAISEYKEHLGRGDFMVRNVLGVQNETGAVVIGEVPRVGQTVQFMVRDSNTATEDLQLLLDSQVLKSDPLAALLFTCNGRGRRLFEEENHDISIIDERLGKRPVTGFFASGEIGPVAGRPFLHGHAATLAILRPLQDEPE